MSTTTTFDDAAITAGVAARFANFLKGERERLPEGHALDPVLSGLEQDARDIIDGNTTPVA